MTQSTTAQVAANIGRQIGLARAAKNSGDKQGQQNHAEAALASLKGVELNYENLDWRQLAEGDAQVLVGNPAAAEKAYRQAMIAAPQENGGYQRLAELLHEQGRTDDLVKHMEVCMKKFPNDNVFLKLQAIQAAAEKRFDIAIPALANAYANNNDDHAVADALGTCLQNINHYDEAVLYHARAFELQPTNAAYLVRYGLAFAGAGAVEGATECFRIAATLDPNYADAYAYLGYSLQAQGKLDEAREAFMTGLERCPDHPTLHFYAGRLFHELQQAETALKHFDVAAKGDNSEAATAKFISASIRGETPETPPAAFVKGLFDFYAPNFEAALMGNLQYRAPATLHELLLSSAVTAVRKLAAGNQRILDLGCGTGLVGVTMKPYANTLVGVDLSANMLQRANAKGIYDLTYCRDILDYIKDMPENHYEVVMAADVFIYVGNIDPVFAALSEKLAPSSLFAFSVEKLDETAPGAGFTLRNTVRYGHKDSYVRDLAARYGFDVLAVSDSPVRQSAGEPIEGLHYVLAKR